MLPESPIELEPEPSRSPARGRGVWIAGVAVTLAAIVAVLAVAAGGGSGDDSGDAIETGLLARAMRNTTEADEFAARFEMHIDRGTIVVDISAAANRISVSQRAGATRSDGVLVDGTYYTLESGTWREWPMRDAAGGVEMAQLSDSLAAIDPTSPQIVRSDGEQVVYSARCSTDLSTTTQVGQLCATDPSAELRITVDVPTAQVVSVDYAGDIPIYAGVWEEGTLRITIVTDAPPPIERPAEVDHSGVECIATHLGVEATSAAIQPELTDLTTDDLRDLYPRDCDFLTWPKGKDFGVR